MPTSRLEYYEQLLASDPELLHVKQQSERERKTKLLVHCVIDGIPQTLEEFEQTHPQFELPSD